MFEQAEQPVYSKLQVISDYWRLNLYQSRTNHLKVYASFQVEADYKGDFEDLTIELSLMNETVLVNKITMGRASGYFTYPVQSYSPVERSKLVFELRIQWS